MQAPAAAGRSWPRRSTARALGMLVAEQPARHARGGRRPRARLRAPAHRPPRRPRRLHRRPGDRRGGRARRSPTSALESFGARAARDRHRRRDDVRRGRGTARGGRGAARADPRRARAGDAGPRRRGRCRSASRAWRCRLAVIRVGAPTEVELNERMRRTEGALAATRAAVAEGIVAGGGTALLRARSALDGLEPRGRLRRAASTSCARVLAEPLYWIASNAGFDGQAVVDQVRAMPDGHGLDALTGEFGDLYRAGRHRPRARHAAEPRSTRRRSPRCCSPPRRSSPRS